jgi:hypothetical protein
VPSRSGNQRNFEGAIGLRQSYFFRLGLVALRRQIFSFMVDDSFLDAEEKIVFNDAVTQERKLQHSGKPSFRVLAVDCYSSY